MKYNEVVYDDGCIMQEPEAEDCDSTDDESLAEESEDDFEQNQSRHGALSFYVSQKLEYAELVKL